MSPSEPAAVGRRLLEAAAQRFLGVDIEAEQDLRQKLVEATLDLGLEQRLGRRMRMLYLNAVGRMAHGQDRPARTRIQEAEEVRIVARRDSAMLYSIRLRNAFCFGKGVTVPKANDDEVQALLDDLWQAPQNTAELTGPEAQWKAGRDLWEVCNVYHLVFADGLDGRVLLAGLQHDQVRDVVRDPKVWRRILYYAVAEFTYSWNFTLNAITPNAQSQIVYYEALTGMAELEEELTQGRPFPTEVQPPPARLRPGRVLHVAINQGREQAFGEPELATGVQWAASFKDLLAGPVEKARAAQKYLVQFTATGASTPEMLRSTAIRTVGRHSPLSLAFDGLGVEAEREREMRSEAGSELWGNESLKAAPLNLESGAAAASDDMESASHGFAAATNFPGHYFFGDPGSLAGASAVELPVRKLSDQDQEVWRSVFRRICDLRIDRAMKVGLLKERRPPTDDEITSEIELGPDGMVERDLTYEINMPPVLDRNLPEMMQIVVDTATTFDPQGQSEPLERALLGFVLGDLLEFRDTPALVERIFAEAEGAGTHIGGGVPPMPGAPPTTGSTGIDGEQHTSANPYGVNQNSPSVEAVSALLGRLADPDDPLTQAVAAHVAGSA